MSENIVNFPTSRIVRESINVEAIELAKEKSTQKFADTITEDLIGNMIEDLENSGLDVDTDSFMKDFSLTVDSLRATVYRHFSIDHHLHEFIDNNVKMVKKKDGDKYISPQELVDEEE